MNNGEEDDLMDKLGNAGLTTMAIIRNTITDKDDMSDTAKAAPVDLGAGDLPTKLMISSLLAVYEASGGFE